MKISLRRVHGAVAGTAAALALTVLGAPPALADTDHCGSDTFFGIHMRACLTVSDVGGPWRYYGSADYDGASRGEWDSCLMQLRLFRNTTQVRYHSVSCLSVIARPDLVWYFRGPEFTAQAGYSYQASLRIEAVLNGQTIANEVRSPQVNGPHGPPSGVDLLASVPAETPGVLVPVQVP